MLYKIATDEDFQFDQLKLYPLDIVPYTDFYDEFKRGLIKLYSEKLYVMPIFDKFLLAIYNILMWFNIFLPFFLHFKCKRPKVFSGKKYAKPYTVMHELLLWFKTIVPPWIRINRLKRDIPSQYIEGGNEDVSMRQVIHTEMKLRDLKCMCIRCREVKKQKIDPKIAKLFTTIYRSSGGTEYFISYETIDRSVLFGFLRLRFNDNNDNVIFDELLNAALIRELHVYGQTISVSDKSSKDTTSQHKGFGTRLLNAAFNISRKHAYDKIAVISGVGVRNYYRKFGFVDEPHFLVKYFTDDNSFSEINEDIPIIIDYRTNIIDYNTTII
jgi:histone acetyltransferase (RNA polymerase elongator complex component)